MESDRAESPRMKVKPPWWLKPANKVFIQMSKLGLSFGGESPVMLTVPAASPALRGPHR